MADYRFVDHWQIRAPIETVYRAVADPRTYVHWWHDYDRVRIINDVPFPSVGGVAELLVRSPFGYRLRLEVMTEEARPPAYLKTVTRGQLEGTGVWEFAEVGDATHATWTWIVRSRHPVLNRLEWLAKPIFARSHAIVSERGHRGLKGYLEGQSKAGQAEV
jgi:uncharacterized protein YndB with AHSA1/START domain